MESIQTTNPQITLIVTGDIIPARTVNSTVVSKNDFLYPYEKTREILQSGDILLVNLESPLLLNCPVTNVGMIFCGSSKNVEGLKSANKLVIANLANNHTGNYGLEGIQKTIDLLNSNGIRPVGTNSPVIVNVLGKRFGFLGFNSIGDPKEGLAWATNENVSTQITDLRPQVDFVIVSFHWGTEYTHQPTPWQVDMAHLAIDSGADLIIGNHPHWVQTTEIYKGKFIAYAHGNFIFDQMWSQKTREGVIGKYLFDNSGLVKTEFIPIIIENFSQPRLADLTESKSILNNMGVKSE